MSTGRGGGSHSINSVFALFDPTQNPVLLWFFVFFSKIVVTVSQFEI